ADVWFGGAGPEVFDRYTRQRRKAQVDYVQAQTIQNKRSLEEKDPVIRPQHLDELRRISEDVNLHKQFLYRAALIDGLNSANVVEGGGCGLSRPHAEEHRSAGLATSFHSTAALRCAR